MSTIGARVAQARKKLHLSQGALGKAVGLTQQAIDAIENGRARSSPKIVDIARALKVSPEWLQDGGVADQAREWQGLTASSPAENLVEVGGEEFARLPVYDIRFAAGAGAQNYEEEPIAHHLMPMSFLRGMTDAPLSMIGVFQVIGDSMEPTIGNRDWVVIDKRRVHIANPGIYALVFEGEGLLKRAERHLENGSVTLISDNPRYPPQLIKKPANLSVVGRVMLSIHRH